MKLCSSSPSKLDVLEALVPSTPTRSTGSGGRCSKCVMAFSAYYSRSATYSALFPMTTGKEICKRIFVVAVMKNIIIPSAKKGFKIARLVWSRASVAFAQLKTAEGQLKHRVAGMLLAAPVLCAAVILWLPVLTLSLVIASPLWVTLVAAYCVARQFFPTNKQITN